MKKSSPEEKKNTLFTYFVLFLQNYVHIFDLIQVSLCVSLREKKQNVSK